MEMFKDKSGVIFAYDDDQILMGLAKDKSLMTQEEVDSHINPRLSDDEIQQSENIKARNFLISTDWYVIRKQETGEEVPPTILEARAAARLSIIE